jgi:2-polyprenyl-6-methoxyphenol hydroxylase-like FAD-dependent oxidoreductase
VAHLAWRRLGTNGVTAVKPRQGNAKAPPALSTRQINRYVEEVTVPLTTTQVLVVGAGPTGLTLGCELLRRGIHCRVIDKVTTFHTRSRGKGLQPRSLEVFDDLGIAQETLDSGRADQHLHVYAGGRLVADLNLPARPPQPGVPYPNLLVIPQWRTEQILRQRLTSLGGSVELGQELEALDQDGDAVTATVLDRATGVPQRIAADYVVGCDGGSSTVRRLAGVSLHGDRHREHFVLGDVEIDGLPADGSSFAWFDGNRYLAADPLSGTGVWQVQASVQPNAAGELETASLELFQRLFTERGFPQVRLRNATWLSNFSPNVAIVDRYRVGRVLLAGDAAHVHSPAGGQGMNTGIQDAYNLGWKLAAVVRGRSGAGLLDTYQEERRPVAQSVLNASDLGHSAVFSPNPVMSFLRERILMPILQLPATQHAILDRASELDVGYRGSSLSREHDGRITVLPHHGGETADIIDRIRFQRGPRAGDRAPDARVRSAADGSPIRLFDRFRGTHFTLLLFDGHVSTTSGYERMASAAQEIRELVGDDVRPCLVVPAESAPAGLDPTDVLLDPEREAHSLYGATTESLYLVRPDGYVGFRGQPVEPAPLHAYLAAVFTQTAAMADRR